MWFSTSCHYSFSNNNGCWFPCVLTAHLISSGWFPCVCCHCCSLSSRSGFPHVATAPFPRAIPTNICWSSTRLQPVFNITMFRLPRRLEDISKDVLKTSWKTKNCYAEEVLKTSLEDVLKTCLKEVLKTYLEDVLKTSWRGTKCLLGISVFNHGLPANLNQYLTNLYLINLYFTNLRRIRNALIRTQ